MIFDPKRIIWSADVSMAELAAVVRSGVLPPGTVIKLDQKFLIEWGLLAPLENKRPAELTIEDMQSLLEFYHVIGLIQEREYRIFVDWKLSEIPTKVEQVATLFGRLNPFMLNCMAGIYSTGIWEDPNPQRVDGLKRFAEACKQVGIRPCAVTVLTPKSPEAVEQEFHRSPPEQVMFYANLLAEAGFTDLVCSAKEAELILADPKLDSLQLNCPGIRLPGTDVRDQARVMTPRAALEFGVHRLVIGSNLTDGPEEDIVERVSGNLARLIAHIEGGEYVVN